MPRRRFHGGFAGSWRSRQTPFSPPLSRTKKGHHPGLGYVAPCFELSEVAGYITLCLVGRGSRRPGAAGSSSVSVAGPTCRGFRHGLFAERIASTQLTMKLYDNIPLVEVNFGQEGQGRRVGRWGRCDRLHFRISPGRWRRSATACPPPPPAVNASCPGSSQRSVCQHGSGLRTSKNARPFRRDRSTSRGHSRRISAV